MNPLRSACWRLLLWIVSIPLWSRLFGRIVRIRRPRRLSLRLIRSFASAYAIPMEEFVGRPEDYASLGEFFVRPLDPAVRPLPPRPDFFLSPADGRLSRLQDLDGDALLQVKGHAYPLSAVVGEPLDFSRGGWQAATIYLAPGDYHRFHYPVTGRIRSLRHFGRRLFPVNELSVSCVRRLYLRNERVTLGMESGGTLFYVVAVGATFVGSIRMACLERLPRRGIRLGLDLPVLQAAEMGRFEQGSTLIVAVPRGWAAEWLAAEGGPVRAGEPLFRLSGL